MTHQKNIISLTVLLMVGLFLCGSDGLAQNIIDDLKVESISPSSVTLVWTAPAEDELVEKALYEIRMSTKEITDQTIWHNLQKCSDLSQPAFAGAPESYTVKRLSCNTTYYFGVYYYGSISNVVKVTIPKGIFEDPVSYSFHYPEFIHWEMHCAVMGTAADINGDFYPDLIVANGEENVSVMLNNGDGTFNDPVAYRKGIGCEGSFIAAADLNSDKAVDLVQAYYCEDLVGIYINMGDGSFYSRKTYGRGGRSSAVCVDDFDGDSDNDLAVSDWENNNVAIMLNNGDATFTEALFFAVGEHPNSLCAADFNGDGPVDLAVVNSASNEVAVLLNIGGGAFGEPQFVKTGSGPFSVVAADFNKDNRIDLAVANIKDNTVSVLLNSLNGTFKGTKTFEVGINPRGLCTADFNNNGLVDIAVVNEGSSYPSNVSVLINNGDGSFKDAVNYGTGEGPRSVFAADFDHDGDMDMGVTNFYAGTVYIYINNSIE